MKPTIYKNMENSALRIEKHGKKLRFLYSNGKAENAAVASSCVIFTEFSIIVSIL